MTDYVVSAQPTIDLQHVQGVAGVDRSDGALKVYTFQAGTAPANWPADAVAVLDAVQAVKASESKPDIAPPWAK